MFLERQGSSLSSQIMIYLIAWFLFSALLLVFTLARPHPYRFPRFLVFECILSLIFLNAGAWFREPFSLPQILSWILLAGSLYLAGRGFYQIKTQGEPGGDFEDTSVLITTGAYKYIRHPLYTSLFMFSLGIFLKEVTVLGFILLITAAWGVNLTASVEEKFNLERRLSGVDIPKFLFLRPSTNLRRY